MAQNDLLYGSKNFIFLGPVGYCSSGYHQPTVGLAKVLAFIEYKSERVVSNKELVGGKYTKITFSGKLHEKTLR